jgi:hypothetical protein
MSDDISLLVRAVRSTDDEVAACKAIRDHVEAKLAEVRAVDQHFIDQCELKAHNATVALADRDRTIAEQATELEKLRKLATFAQHDPAHCRRWSDDSPGKCTCGFDAARTALQETAHGK